MGRAERQGWNTWERFKEAGVVEDTLLFNDDPIIVDNALGRTRKALGICWPIDAAVAYTLASHGPDAELTWKDMVNQNTRIATAMMSGKVQWGELQNPHAESCGHDEVDCYEMYFGMPRLNSKGFIEFAHVDDMNKWPLWRDGEVPESVMRLMKFRVSNEWVNENDAYNSLVLSPLYAEVREFIENLLGTDKWDYEDLLETTHYSKTKGECGWADDEEKKGQCAHHDKALYEGWVMIRDEEDPNAFMKLWTRGKHSVVSSRTHIQPLTDRLGWNYTNNVSRERVVVFDRVKRSLAQTVPEATVVNAIKDSVARMRKWDGRCLVDKQGRGHSSRHKWSDWGWLAEMAAWIQDTHSKNRKENETQCRICYANGEEDEYGNSLCRCGEGWQYIKYDSTQSFGHEIAKFEWRPINPKNQIIYVLKFGREYLPWRFKTMEEAAQMREFFAVTGTKLPNISLKNRTWDMALGQEDVALSGKDTGIKVIGLSTMFSMKWDQDPENLPTPRECLHAIQWGSPLERENVMERLTTAMFKQANQYGTMKHYDFKEMKVVNTIENIEEPQETVEDSASGIVIPTIGPIQTGDDDNE